MRWSSVLDVAVFMLMACSVFVMAIVLSANSVYWASVLWPTLVEFDCMSVLLFKAVLIMPIAATFDYIPNRWFEPVSYGTWQHRMISPLLCVVAVLFALTMGHPQHVAFLFGAEGLFGTWRLQLLAFLWFWLALLTNVFLLWCAKWFERMLADAWR